MVLLAFALRSPKKSPSMVEEISTPSDDELMVGEENPPWENRFE